MWLGFFPFQSPYTVPQFLHCWYPKDLQILIQTGSSSSSASVLSLQPHFPAIPSCFEATPPYEEMPIERNTEFSRLTFVIPPTAIIKGKRNLRQILLVTDYIAVFEEEITWLHTHWKWFHVTTRF